MSAGSAEPAVGTRREFLGRAAAAGLACAAGLVAIGGCGTSRASSRSTRQQVPEGAELIHEPLILRDGDSLVDRHLVVSETFRNTPDHAVVRVAGNRVKIRNVELQGADTWQARWNDLDKHNRALPGMFGRTVGIRIENVQDVSLEQIEIRGLPQAGIQGFGIEGGSFHHVRLERCYHGMQFLPIAPSRRIHFEQVHARDMWGPALGHWDKGGRIPSHAQGHPSRSRPGGFVGGDGLVLNTLRDSVVADCSAVGELFASFKMTNPQRLEVKGVVGGGIQIQGTADREWKIHKTPARDVWIHGCEFDKALVYPFDLSNCIQIAQNVASVRIEDCTLASGGKNGHAIQVTVNSHAEVVGCTIRGFNGRRGQNPAHAIDVAHGSTINDDFERVNTFVDQKRIRLERNPGRRKPSG